MYEVNPNRSAHTDKQHQIAASRRVLHAGGLRRYASEGEALSVSRYVTNPSGCRAWG